MKITKAKNCISIYEIEFALLMIARLLKILDSHSLFLKQLLDIKFEYKQNAVKIIEQKNKSKIEFFK